MRKLVGEIIITTLLAVIFIALFILSMMFFIDSAWNDGVITIISALVIGVAFAISLVITISWANDIDEVIAGLIFKIEDDDEN